MRLTERKNNDFHFRFSDNFKFVIDSLCKINNLNMTELIELAILNLANNTHTNCEIIIEGIDFSKFSEMVKQSYYRKIESFSKAELLSKKLLIKRLNYDFQKLRSCGKGDIKNAKLLLEEYKKIAKHYTEPEEVIKELENVEKQLNSCIELKAQDSINIDNALNGNTPKITYNERKKRK